MMTTTMMMTMRRIVTMAILISFSFSNKYYYNAVFNLPIYFVYIRIYFCYYLLHRFIVCLSQYRLVTSAIVSS